MDHKNVLDLEVLSAGRCEPLKAAVHGVLLVTMGVCAAYNTAAFLKRRQTHLAVNGVIYTLAVVWEHCHVMHHLNACTDVPAPVVPASDLSDAA